MGKVSHFREWEVWQIEIAKSLGCRKASEVMERFESATILGKQLYRLRDALVRRI